MKCLEHSEPAARIGMRGMDEMAGRGMLILPACVKE
jgi:hypothetical protein